jgi:hypothetical protein
MKNTLMNAMARVCIQKLQLNQLKNIGKRIFCLNSEKNDAIRESQDK